MTCPLHPNAIPASQRTYDHWRQRVEPLFQLWLGSLDSHMKVNQLATICYMEGAFPMAYEYGRDIFTSRWFRYFRDELPASERMLGEALCRSAWERGRMNRQENDAEAHMVRAAAEEIKL